MPDQHPYNLGNLGQIGTKPSYEAMEQADLLLMIGTSFPYRDFLPEKAPAIQIDNDPTQIGKRYPVDVGLVASSERVLSWFNENLNGKENQNFLKSCQENKSNWETHLNAITTAEENKPMRGPNVIRKLQENIDDHAVLAVDVGNVTSWTARFFQMTQHSFVVSSWLATMGCGLPAAIAAKINEPDRQVVAICGDGGFSMVMQDFLTAVKYELPIIVVILNNQKIGMIKYEQEAMGNIPYQTNIEDMDYAQFAKACGGEGFEASNETEFVQAIKAAQQIDKPVIINAIIEEKAPLARKNRVGSSHWIFKIPFQKNSREKTRQRYAPLKNDFEEIIVGYKSIPKK